VTKAIARDPIYQGRRFQSEIIELCVRWYLTYGLSYRDLVAMMAERGVTLSHTQSHPAPRRAPEARSAFTHGETYRSPHVVGEGA
jgi:transposase-like protein